MPDEAQRCPSKWGEDDQRGAANWMTPESVRRAASLIRTGEVYELGEVLTDDPAVSYINRGLFFNIYTKSSVPEPDTRVASEELVVTELGQIGTQLAALRTRCTAEVFTTATSSPTSQRVRVIQSSALRTSAH